MGLSRNVQNAVALFSQTVSASKHPLRVPNLFGHSGTYCLLMFCSCHNFYVRICVAHDISTVVNKQSKQPNKTKPFTLLIPDSFLLGLTSFSFFHQPTTTPLRSSAFHQGRPPLLFAHWARLALPFAFLFRRRCLAGLFGGVGFGGAATWSAWGISFL